MTNTAKRLAIRNKLFADMAAEYAAAPVVHTDRGICGDVFDRAYSRVSVELCQGTWCTFTRLFSTQTESGWKQHPSRESACAYARDWLNR